MSTIASHSTLGPLRVQRLGPGDDALLQRFVVHEAVIPVRSRADLGRRLGPDRRLLVVRDHDGAALAFVQVALGSSFPQSLDCVLASSVADASGEPPRSATLYGITRVHDRARGHAGALLHAATDHLVAELPSLRSVATLSPIPAFGAWVRQRLAARGHDPAAAARAVQALARTGAAGLASPPLLHDLAHHHLAARDADGRPVDPVARFHLGNGARLRRVLVGADGSWHGLEQSLGVMASYRYLPDAPTEAPLPDTSLDDLLADLLRLRGAA